MSTSETKNKYFALGFTIGFHALLFLLFILIVFITPIPPFPIPPSIEVELSSGMEGMGAEAGGSGNHDNDIKTSPEDAASVAATNTSPNVVTDESATDVSVKKNPNAKPEAKEELKTPEEEKASQELLAALEKLKSKKKHSGEGEGSNNTGGSGNGTSTGVGNGNDPEEGNGNQHGQGGRGGWDLKGRSLVKKPDRLTDATEEGVVVVLIIVDENGKVVDAIPGQRGTTTFSEKLFSKARLAAKQAKFNPSPEGIKEQRGTYTFVFTLE